jgi:hypothetical protein
MSAILITAADTSKVPFYILGAVLALYAVILSFIGIRNPAFPYGKRGQRGVTLLTVVLVVCAIGAAILTG